MASTYYSLQPLLLSLTLFSLIFSVFAQTCTKYKFSNKKVFTSCSDLPVLNSFLHWNYNPKTFVVNLAYRQPGLISNSRRWISWGINPMAKGMKGAQSLVAFIGTDGSMRAYTSPITAYRTTLEPGDLSFPVSDVSAVLEKNEMIIFASIQLLSNSSKVNHLWQEGPLNGDIPGIHALSAANMESMATLDFLSGKTATVGGGNSKQKNKNVHGVLSAVSWGILMPLGIIMARYLKVSESAGPAWFYLHASCQVSAYIVGVAGWLTGLKLGSTSSGLQYNAHRNIGIALFCLGTLQVFALFLRPKPNHKYRLYWNMYHQGTGNIVIILSIINIYKGFDILDPEKKWKQAYTIVLTSLGGIAVAFEALTWIIVIRRRKASMNNTSV
ncbi:Cytochrome b561 and domon domain-containing protein [Thalictrum thalictroides]|uniref:Cytochrome b561 and DOMON domain-containing protein n=1 Tax=Thalictrum thalictroides TaxID=46969 RepID=A0A7J6WJ20_THATH|nr:Cytochrome b561 and domon domain-containing protein [Thalictrum thalictroides]